MVYLEITYHDISFRGRGNVSTRWKTSEHSKQPTTSAESFLESPENVSGPKSQ